MKSLTDLTELFLRRAEARLEKASAYIGPKPDGAFKNTFPEKSDFKPGTPHSPGGLHNQQLVSKKPMTEGMTPEELKEQDSRIMQMYQKREENKAKQKKLEQNKRDSEESDVENAAQASKEKIREVVSVHPEFANVMSFIEYLNEGGQDIFSRPQFEIMCSLHGMDPKEFMTVMNAAGKFEMRTDRKVKLPSEVIQEAATQAGVDRQQLFQYLNTLAPESMPLGVAGIVEAWKYKGMSPHEMRVMKLREKQNRNSASLKADDDGLDNIEASWMSNVKLAFDENDIKKVDDKESEDSSEDEDNDPLKHSNNKKMLDTPTTKSETKSDTNEAKPWDKTVKSPSAPAKDVPASAPSKAAPASSSSTAAPSVTEIHPVCTVDYSK